MMMTIVATKTAPVAVPRARRRRVRARQPRRPHAHVRPDDDFDRGRTAAVGGPTAAGGVPVTGSVRRIGDGGWARVSVVVPATASSNSPASRAPTRAAAASRLARSTAASPSVNLVARCVGAGSPAHQALSVAASACRAAATAGAAAGRSASRAAPAAVVSSQRGKRHSLSTRQAFSTS